MSFRKFESSYSHKCHTWMVSFFHELIKPFDSCSSRTKFSIGHCTWDILLCQQPSFVQQLSLGVLDKTARLSLRVCGLMYLHFQSFRHDVRRKLARFVLKAFIGPTIISKNLHKIKTLVWTFQPWFICKFCTKESMFKGIFNTFWSLKTINSWFTCMKRISKIRNFSVWFDNVQNHLTKI